jgi:arginase family enzyme
MGAGRAFGQDSPVSDGRRVAIMGAELDLGAGRRGVDMGPSAIRYAGLGERLATLGIPSEDWGNVYTEDRGDFLGPQKSRQHAGRSCHLRLLCSHFPTL